MKSRPKKVAVRLLAISVGLVIIFLLIILRHSETRFTPTDGDWLQISAKYQVPMREVSGIAQLDDKIYIVGDSDPELAILDFATLEVLQHIDFADLLRERFSLCINAQNNICKTMLKNLGTQWEGIHVSSDGIALLQENTGSVLIFDLQVTTIKGHLLIDYRGDAKIKTNENSLGEGIILLNDGNILIAKEKLPTAIMEFTAQKQSHQDGFIRKEMQAIHTWQLTSEDKQCDLSDITRDPNSGIIYGISQTCHSIYKFKTLHKDDDELTVEQRWRIPDEVTAPEALLVTRDGKFIVCSDISQIRDNIFVLEKD